MAFQFFLQESRGDDQNLPILTHDFKYRESTEYFPFCLVFFFQPCFFTESIFVRYFSVCLSMQI